MTISSKLLKLGRKEIHPYYTKIRLSAPELLWMTSEEKRLSPED